MNERLTAGKWKSGLCMSSFLSNINGIKSTSSPVFFLWHSGTRTNDLFVSLFVRTLTIFAFEFLWIAKYVLKNRKKELLHPFSHFRRPSQNILIPMANYECTVAPACWADNSRHLFGKLPTVCIGWLHFDSLPLYTLRVIAIWYFHSLYIPVLCQDTVCEICLKSI